MEQWELYGTNRAQNAIAAQRASSAWGRRCSARVELLKSKVFRKILFLNAPPTQDRLNAVVAECIRLRITGPITIAGNNWNEEELINYLESKYNTCVATFNEEQTLFSINSKTIHVHPDCVVIMPEKT